MTIVKDVMVEVWKDLGENENDISSIKLEWLEDPYEVAYYSPFNNTIKMNLTLASHATDECLTYILWHELIHVKMVFDLARKIHKEKDEKKRRTLDKQLIKLVTDDKYMHGRKFQSLMKKCPYGPETLNCLYEKKDLKSENDEV